METITEDFCSYEVAKLLKEKGFDYKGFDYIDFEGEVIRQDRPTHQMAMKWLREVHKLHIGIVRGPKGYHITIETIPLGVVKYITREIVGTTYVDSYEEAVESALKYVLENLI